MDRLNKSLDQIMDEDQKANKKPKKTQRSEQKGKGHKNERLSSGNKPNRDVQFQNRRFTVAVDNSEDKFVAPTQPVIVRTIERPKYVKSAATAPSTAAAAPQSQFVPQQQSTIFSRLGQNGVTVNFHNLIRTISEADVQELCRAIGDVRSVKLQGHSSGFNTARAVFATQADADRCVATYDARTLDGVAMRVSLETAQPQGIFGRLEAAAVPAVRGYPSVVPAKISFNGGENVRAGFFGTALPAEGGGRHQQQQQQRQQQVSYQGSNMDDDKGEDEAEDIGGRRVVFNNGGRNGGGGARQVQREVVRPKKLIRRNQQDGGGRSFKGRKLHKDGSSGGGNVNLDDDLDNYMANRG